MPTRKKTSLVSINLLKSTHFEYTSLGKTLNWLMTFGKYIVFLTFLLVIIGFLYRFSLDRKIENLNERIEDNIENIKQFSDVEQSIKKFQKKLASVREINESVRFETNTLGILEKSLPPKTKLEKINISEDAITLTGTAANEIVLANLVSSLKQQQAFKEIAITSLQSGGIVNPTILFEMKLIIDNNYL